MEIGISILIVYDFDGAPPSDVVSSHSVKLYINSILFSFSS